ncbi:hypothetical protein BKG91_11755 [Rodentibacter caecimuris]|uniref:KilA-N domain-containing protein n=1 Tax=Rodentibacter caecimuris TaxID=1796644 RepID=A0AAJ3K3V0_9PAST|nr:KilA-N domain-containing protein [Rodentibacter heylii]AOF54482.1 Phage DNA and RNA binding protein [Pasteurellaceae bacterium NI1060]OOF71090.1 hypothetical protein BKG91_11755 [Rodentibacter heylii]OOF71701.1 hypothetical protein BKG90_07405 [Rodentibacter heylii]
MTNLSILKTSIRSLDGLYSLTDLHKASGGDEKHKPVLFLRLDQTKDLISEIENDKVQICTLPVKTVRGGKNPSTYACEELVLAYATWISPKFHLVVLRAFLAMHRNEPKQIALPEPPKMYQRELTEKEMQDFCWAWYGLRNYIELTDKLQKQFGGFGGDYARAIRQLNERYGNLPQEMLPTLQRITTEFNQDITHGNGWNRIIYNVRHPNAIIRSGGLVHLF